MNKKNKPAQSQFNKFTTNIFGDTYLPSINGKKFDEIAYSTYFDIDILPQLSKEFTFYIFIGTDSGMMLKHLQLLNTDPNSIYLFIEDKKVLDLLSASPFSTKSRRPEANGGLGGVNILTSTINDWQEIAKKADIIKYIEVDRVQTIKSFSAQEQTYPQYVSIAQQIHDDINQLKWIHTGKFQRKILAYDSRSI